MVFLSPCWAGSLAVKWMRGKAWAVANAKIRTPFCQPQPKALSLWHRKEEGDGRTSVMGANLRGRELTALSVCRRRDRKAFNSGVWSLQTQLTGQESPHTVSRLSAVRNLNRCSPSPTQLGKAASNYCKEKSFSPRRRSIRGGRQVLLSLLWRPQWAGLDRWGGDKETEPAFCH